MNDNEKAPAWAWAIVARLGSCLWIAPFVYQFNRMFETAGYEQLGHITLFVILGALIGALWMVGVNFRD